MFLFESREGTNFRNQKAAGWTQLAQMAGGCRGLENKRLEGDSQLAVELDNRTPPPPPTGKRGYFRNQKKSDRKPEVSLSGRKTRSVNKLYRQAKYHATITKPTIDL